MRESQKKEINKSNSDAANATRPVRNRISLAALASVLGVLLLAFYLPFYLPDASARGGGGHSYSGGSRSSSSSSSRSSSSGGSTRTTTRTYSYGTTSPSSNYNNGNSNYTGGSYSSGGYRSSSGSWLWLAVVPLIGITVLFVIVGFVIFARRKQGAFPVAPVTAENDLPVAARFEELRKFDPNFSEILFTDFIYALYAQVQKARGRKDLDNYTSYLDASVIEKLKALAGPDLKDVTGVIVGASHIQGVSDPAQSPIHIAVEFQTNYTEVTGAGVANTLYSRERWNFTRNRDVLSRSPEKVTAIHCPSCGGALEKKPDGSCAYCGVKIVGGEFDWFVTDVQIMERESKGPLLTVDVPEVGTDFPTVMQSNFEERRQQFIAQNPDFAWEQVEARMRYIFMELQQAWTSLKWERVRPYETDNVFQMHYFWINEYQRQNLRNVLDQIQIARIEPVKVTMDAFYDSITVRIYASMLDYTVDAQGTRVCGDPRNPRLFTEYWTFMRRRGVKASDKANDQCPNCAAPLQISMSGACEFCGGKVTSGEFDWVLSRIEQDESYRG